MQDDYDGDFLQKSFVIYIEIYCKNLPVWSSIKATSDIVKSVRVSYLAGSDPKIQTEMLRTELNQEQSKITLEMSY